MIQNLIVIFLFGISVFYVFRKFFPIKKNSNSENSCQSSGCSKCSASVEKSSQN
ncbi:FeoB-associated Cys-rich membrane protein [Aureibacter tunicatorum]|uniref:FeoB-associated Cys-rich membrane protein n=1 Tax=Aureibacter tunicatorum TaxID=866807 RepID=UPI0035B5546E